MKFTKKVILLPIFLCIACIPICNSVNAEEPQCIQSYVSVGVGWEQLSYTEEVPELSLVASDTEVNNLVLYFDGTKRLNDYFVSLKGILPVTYGDTQEYWEKAGQYVQSNSLAYRRTKVDVFFGYILNHLFNPYIGTSWSYSHQERNDFQTSNTPGVTKISITEEVNSLSLLLGFHGRMPINTKWSFAYFLEYLHPYYSKVENSSLAGWEPSNIDGYSFSLTGQLELLIAEKTALIVQAVGGQQNWDGSDWETVGNSQVKWPENETIFIGGYVNFKKYF